MTHPITRAKAFRENCRAPDNLDSSLMKFEQAVRIIDELLIYFNCTTQLQIAARELEAASKAGLAHRRKLARAAAKIEPNKRRPKKQA